MMMKRVEYYCPISTVDEASRRFGTASLILTNDKLISLEINKTKVIDRFSSITLFRGTIFHARSDNTINTHVLKGLKLLDN